MVDEENEVVDIHALSMLRERERESDETVSMMS